MTKLWLKAAGIRAVKTMAQSALAVIGNGWGMLFTYKCGRIARGK